MADFSYIAIDTLGKEKKGRVEAPDKDRAFQSLKSEGLYPVSINEATFLNKDIKFEIGNTVKPRDLSVFTRQFSSILKAGVPIISALEMLIDQTENKALKSAVQNTELMVEKGERLADAMQTQGKVFPSIFINMIRAGESSGSLEVSLDRMSSHFEKEAKLKSLVKRAMIYPIMLGFVSLGVIILMLSYVIPNFMKMFTDMDMKMPAVTLAVVAVSNFIIKRWYVIILFVAVIVFSIIMIKRTEQGEIFFAKMELQMPLFGKIKLKTYSARFTRTMSTLLASGITVIDAVDIASKTMDNVVIKDMLLHSKEEVARGVPLSVPLMMAGVFPPMVYHMIKVGENTGSLESMLTTIADYYDEEVEASTESLTAIMEPLIIIVLALVVGGLIFTIMQPLFSMYDQLDTAMMK